MNLPTEFREELRYEYPLTESDLVIDAGGFKGTFSRQIWERYKCRLIVFEPIRQFYEDTVNALVGTGSMIFNSGVGVRTEEHQFFVKGDMTGLFAEGGTQLVQLIDFPTTLIQMDEFPALLKLNIEGMEFEVLEALLDRNLATRIRNIQVQFHRVIPDAEQRHANIRERLLKTHHLTFDFPWCWENYRMNE